MLKNKLSTVINIFKAKSSTSAKTLGSGLFAAGTIGMVRAVSKIDISSLEGNSEDKVNKQDLISLYDYINEATQEENYNIYADNLDKIKSKISKCKLEGISNLVANKFYQDGWNITSNDGSSLLTVAIERIGKEQKKNRNYDIHVEIAVSLILGMNIGFIIKLENFADSNDKTLLHYLAESGKEDILRFVIENSNFDIEEAVRNKDRDGKTPLHYAAKSGNKECFKILIENEAHFTTTINYKSELHYAARSGNSNFLECLKGILIANAIFEKEKTKTDKYENNALHYAAQSGDAECIKFCIDNQVQFSKNKYNENPLHKIAGNSKTQENAINFLIEHIKLLGRLKNEINREDVDGNTPLHIAAQHGNKQLIELLTKSGAKIVQNKKGNTPLHTAIIHGNPDCIELFYKKIGNSIFESKGEHGRDLVHLAAMYGQFDCLNFLLDKFPDYDLNTKTSKGNTALHLVLSKSTELESRKKCANLLIDRGMQINESNNEKNTPLHYAAQLDSSFLRMIKEKLKEKKFDVYQEVLRENSNGDTVFHMAARVGNKSCLEYLFSLIKKEEIEKILNKKNEDGQTLLYLSIFSGSKECAEHLMEESPISIFPEQNTQKKFLFAAVLGGNKECLEFVTKKLVDKKVAASTKVLYDENNNTLLHMAALANGVVCSQYIIESFSKSTIRKLFNTNNHKLTPLHLAAMSLNAEVIEYFMMDNYLYTEKMLNVVPKSGRTALHYLVMSDNDFEKTINEDFKQDQFLKKLILEKRKQNEHLRDKAIKALLYLTTINRGQIINKKINFDIKDNKGKTFLKYALEYKNISILKLFLDPFYEIRENLKREYDKLELEYQEKSRKILEFITMIMLALNAISYFCIPNDQQSESAIKKTFDSIVMVYSILSLAFMLSNFIIGNQKEPIKRKIESYTEKMNSIEEVTGKLAKTIVEVHNSEGYSAILEQLAKNSEDILQVKSMLDKLMHAVSLESRDKFNISSQKMSRRGSTVLAERRSSSFLGNLGEKLDQYVRRTSRVQDTMDKLDNESCFITINEHSESNPKAPKSKLKNVAIKLKIGNIFSKKKEDLIASSSLSEGANQKKINEESCRLIKQLGDINKNLIFPTFFNSRCSTLREECGNNHRAAHHVSYSSVNNLPSVSKEGVNKFPSVILSSPEVGIFVKETDFLGLECRPRVYSSPPCMSKR